jgi:hypothetical protein
MLVNFVIIYVLVLLVKINDAERSTFSGQHLLTNKPDSNFDNNIKEIFYNETIQSYQIKIEPSNNQLSEQPSKSMPFSFLIFVCMRFNLKFCAKRRHQFEATQL